MPNLGPFKHGVSWADVPTSVIAPVQADVGVNVVFGAAPLHLHKDGKSAINKPLIFNRYEDAVSVLGFSRDWDKYDICEHMDAAFVEFGVFPVIYIACNDPEAGSTSLAPKTVTLVNGQVDTQEELIAWTVVVKDDTGVTEYVEGVDYLLSLSADSKWVITRIATGDIPLPTSVLTLEGKIPTATALTSADIIGGVDQQTGLRTGLEVIEDVFQATGKVPGVIICPKFSSDPVVAAVMEAKCENINGCFVAMCLIDVDTKTVTTAQAVKAWKDGNNIAFPRQQCLFGKPALVGVTEKKVFNFASQQGPLMQWVDAYRGNGLPYHSPSNKPMRMNALLLDNGDELPMHLLDANMLNSQGVITALNFIGGWRSWGNRTACFPANTDVKDMFISVRRMFDFIGNSTVLTIWQKVDEPGNRRLIDAVVNSLQLWLDGLSNSEALLGARIEFRQDENPTTELLNGHYLFHIYIAVPTPAEWIDFRVEYWLPYVQNLWADDQSTAAA
jgi:Bacteriophage tail sheath protein